MSEPWGGTRLGLRATIARYRVAILGGAVAILLGVCVGAGGEANAGPAGPILSKTPGSDIVLIKSQKKAKAGKRGQAAQTQCRPWCPRDTLPCDPPAFKIADGRCDWRDEFW